MPPSHSQSTKANPTTFSNAYNASAPPEPYTGYVEVNDFLQDIMKPQMEALFYQYETDILWCDVGGPTVLPDIAPEWFNRAKQEGRQVVANARCGANYSDFDVSLGCGLKDVRTD